MINLGVIGSTNGTDLQVVLDAIGSGELNAKVSVVLSNQKMLISLRGRRIIMCRQCLFHLKENLGKNLTLK